MHLCQSLFIQFYIRKAEPAEFEAVRAFYHKMIDDMEDAEYKPLWQKDIYPAPDWLREEINKGNLYVGMYGDEIIAAAVMNGEGNDGYKNVTWPSGAKDDEISVIHALAVLPEYSHRGFAKTFVLTMLDKARDTDRKAMRLDVLVGNIPALRLYESLGFDPVAETELFYEDTGVTKFLLMEQIIYS